MIDYHELSLVTFFKILSNEEENIGLLGVEDKAKAKEEWNEIKRKWGDENITADQRTILEAQKKVTDKVIELKKLTLFYQFVIRYEGEDEYKYFNAVKIPWMKDPTDRYNQVDKTIQKVQTELEIYEARLKKTEEAIGKSKFNESGDFDLSDIYKVIASFELYYGVTIEDYSKLTIGRYNAISKLKKSEKKK